MDTPSGFAAACVSKTFKDAIYQNMQQVVVTWSGRDFSSNVVDLKRFTREDLSVKIARNWTMPRLPKDRRKRRQTKVLVGANVRDLEVYMGEGGLTVDLRKARRLTHIRVVVGLGSTKFLIGKPLPTVRSLHLQNYNYDEISDRWSAQQKVHQKDFVT